MSTVGVPGSVHTFVRGVEYWLPDAEGSALRHGGGWYGNGTRMAGVSAETSFARGEGLPGRAWSSGAPVVLHAFEGSYFRRTDAALADGLTCGIALPIFAGERLLAVVVFFCGDDEAHAGAIEVWMNDPRVSKDMALDDGHYGRTSETFEYLSRRIAFRPGTGLPGQAWQQQLPVFQNDLGRASGFLRHDSAVRVGITRGLAVPCATPGPRHFVLTFLSALGTPIARRLEVWRVDAEGRALVLDAGFCEQAGPLHGGAARLEPGQGSVGRCWQDGLPLLALEPSAEPGPVAQVSGLQALLVFPVLSTGRTVAVTAMYF